METKGLQLHNRLTTFIAPQTHQAPSRNEKQTLAYTHVRSQIWAPYNTSRYVFIPQTASLNTPGCYHTATATSLLAVCGLVVLQLLHLETTTLLPPRHCSRYAVR